MTRSSRRGSSVSPAASTTAPLAHELDRRRDVGMQIAVVVEMRNARAQARAHALPAARSSAGAHGSRSPAPPPAARCRRRRGVLRHRQQPPRAVRRHRHVVLLVGRGRDRIDARRIGAAACSRTTSAAAVTCAIMKPELSPGFGVRNAGRPESAGSTSMAMRRSASEPISQIASAIMSAAKATGSAWKLPPDSASSLVRRRSADCRRRRWLPSPASPPPGAADRARRPSPAAGSAGNRGPARARSPVRCEARMALPAISARKRRGGLDLAAMARAARGCADRTACRSPRAASVDSAPVDQRRLRTASRPRTGRPAHGRSRTACR